jgi:diacylglycerol kinase (ATP)
LTVAFQGQEAFRLEVMLAILLLPVALVSDVSPAGRAVMIMSVLGVLGVELANTALEAIVDRISLEPHTLSKQAKDLGSAAVLVSLLNLVLVWLVLLLPRFFRG